VQPPSPDARFFMAMKDCLWQKWQKRGQFVTM
jgi:hypothetical protein